MAKLPDKKNGHICLECGLENNLVVDPPVKITKAKCICCHKSKDGVSKKNYKTYKK